MTPQHSEQRFTHSPPGNRTSTGDSTSSELGRWPTRFRTHARPHVGRRYVWGSERNQGNRPTPGHATAALALQRYALLRGGLVLRYWLLASPCMVDTSHITLLAVPALNLQGSRSITISGGQFGFVCLCSHGAHLKLRQRSQDVYSCTRPRFVVCRYLSRT